MKALLWYIVVFFAILVGIIPILYLFYGVNEGFLELKSPTTLHNNFWWFFLYTHAFSGGLAILIGWLQFNKTLLIKYKKWHRNIGMLYVLSALIASISGLYIAFYATGGIISIIAFVMIAVLYFFTTYVGFILAKKRDFKRHQNFMTYSYAICLAAVSLRLMTTISQILGFDYISSYQYIAWFSWIPNIGIAYLINKFRKETISIT